MHVRYVNSYERECENSILMLYQKIHAQNSDRKFRPKFRFQIPAPNSSDKSWPHIPAEKIGANFCPKILAQNSNAENRLQIPALILAPHSGRKNLPKFGTKFWPGILDRNFGPKSWTEKEDRNFGSYFLSRILDLEFRTEWIAFRNVLRLFFSIRDTTSPYGLSLALHLALQVR